MLIVKLIGIICEISRSVNEFLNGDYNNLTDVSIDFVFIDCVIRIVGRIVVGGVVVVFILLGLLRDVIGIGGW